MKLLLDAMYAPAIAAELRARGHDAVSAHESAALRRAPDAEVLAAATSEGRTLVTEDVRDFRRLEAAMIGGGEHHEGIVYTSDRQFSPRDPGGLGRLVRALDALLRDPPNLRDRSTFLRPA